MEKAKTIVLSQEDYEVAMEALRKHWDEQRKQRAIEIWNNKLRICLDACINEIGLAETKALVRDANRNLRMMEENAC